MIRNTEPVHGQAGVNSASPEESAVLAASRLWVETVVVDLGLCPFARRVLAGEQVQWHLVNDGGNRQVLEKLADISLQMSRQSTPETALLVIGTPKLAFEPFLDVVAMAEALLEQLGLVGVLQLAHFHPEYCFAGESEEAAANYTNRSPYPMLHLLREQSISNSLAEYPDPAGIPVRNISLMRRIGATAMQRRVQLCLARAGKA